MIYIMRGVQGSGKSTWVSKLPESFVRLSADNYYMNNGKYEFDPSKIGTAHNWCLDLFLRAVRDFDVVVDNTNIEIWEFAPYYRVAEAVGRPVQIVEMVCDPEIAAARNIHGVSRRVVIKKHKRLMKIELPNWWNRIKVNYESRIDG